MECRHQQFKWYGLAMLLMQLSSEKRGHISLLPSEYYLPPRLIVDFNGKTAVLIYSIRSNACMWYVVGNVDFEHCKEDDKTPVH